MKRFTYQLLASIVLILIIYNLAGLRNTLLFVIGMLMGILFVVGSVGFTSAWRTLLTRGNPYPFYGQALMLLSGVLIILPVLNLFPSLHRTVAPLSYSSFFGALLFGLGMQLGDGCGSGSIAKMSYNNFSLLVIGPFILGSFLGTLHMNTLTKLGGLDPVDLSATFGFTGALLFQISLIFILCLLAHLWSKHRAWSQPFVWQEYKKLYLSIIGLVVLALGYLLLSGQGWGITFAFGLWGSKIAYWLGFPSFDIPYWTNEGRTLALSRSILFDTTSLTTLGLILGAWLTAAQLRLSKVECKSKRSLVGALIGGLSMGYGAQLAFGCNIGAYFTAISSGSVHGWNWLLFAFIGSIVGIELRKKLGYTQ